MSLIDDAKKILGSADRSPAALKQMQMLHQEALKDTDKSAADYIGNLIEAFLVDGGFESQLKNLTS